MRQIINKIPDYLLIIICLISITGALVYRVYALNLYGVIISLFFVAVLFVIILLLEKKHKDKRRITGVITNQKDAKSINNPTRENSNARKAAQYSIPNTKYYILPAFYFLLLAFNFYTLFKHAADKAIISPWQVLPSYFFIIYALATALLLLILILHSKQKTNNNKYFLITFLVSAHYFLSFSAALIIYKIGFGFDPFVHEATMDIISKNGLIEPKPFYYLGQYSIIIILHKITAVSIATLQKLLVPLLAALFLPYFLLKAFRKLFSFSAPINISLIALLAIPFSFFIVTAPQNLAYFFLICALIIGLKCENIIGLIFVYLLALAALVTQPIAGVPAIMFAFMLTVYHSDISNIKRNLYRIIFFLNAAALPGAFYLLNRSNLAGSGGNLPAGGGEIPALPPLIVPGQENFILNFIYLYAFNLKMAIGALVVAGLIIAWRHRRECKIFSIYLAMSVSVFISYLLTKQLPFDFLIYYERDNFSDRILLVSAFFLLPFILVAVYGIITAVLKQNKFIRIAWLVFLTILITTSFYLSYPRFDNYYNSRGFSVGASDIATVQWINANAKDDYIVLANQQVSAAALRQFGFKKYYKSPIENRQSKIEIFYYPIPTGGHLYGYYLDMVYKKPTHKTMLSAMDLVGVNTAYFVLNKYWWAFPKILAEARLEADSWQEFNNEVFVFKYSR